MPTATDALSMPPTLRLRRRDAGVDGGVGSGLGTVARSATVAVVVALPVAKTVDFRAAIVPSVSFGVCRAMIASYEPARTQGSTRLSFCHVRLRTLVTL